MRNFLGGIGMGYFLSQYDQPNIDNIDYYNQTHEEDNSPFMDLFNHVTSSPFHIIHRFFFSGFMYILIGLVTAGVCTKECWWIDPFKNENDKFDKLYFI